MSTSTLQPAAAPAITPWPYPPQERGARSRNKDARIAGLLYVLMSVFGPLRLVYIPSTLIVNGNPAATANNIDTHDLLFRLGIASDLACATLMIFVALALYRLFRDVDHRLAVLYVILALMATPIFFVNTINDVGALLFARGADFVVAFDKAQRDAVVMLFLSLHHHCLLANYVLWWLGLSTFGLLVYKSRFLPRILGVWLVLDGFAYLAFSIAGMFAPHYEDAVVRYLSPATFGEVAIMLWLVVMGAKELPSSV
jgi:hypothetical protein